MLPGQQALLQLERSGVELVVRAMLGDELVVRATLDDAAVVKHDDHVGVAHGREPVRNHERGTPVHEGVHAPLHDLLGARVDGGRCLIQDHDRRVCNGRARNGEQLALTLRELGGVVGQHRVVALAGAE